ncbi:MAG: carboxylating nicotinate-nucleotide diphosphorylase [Thermoleophilia bacterium]
MTAGLSDGALRAAARAAARRALAEDLAGLGDLAGRAFTAPGRARVAARADGVLSGVAPFLEAARLVDPDLQVAFAFDAGARFSAGATLATLAGRQSAILALERTGLNFLARLSGVATLTARYVAETAGTAAVIAGTRKTTPGLRALEKQAIVDGGGSPHRFGLFDGAMVKDNHVAAAGGLTQAVAAVRAGLSHAHLLEVEVETEAQLDEALAAGVPVILLDNMDVAAVRAAVARVAGRAVLEVSGGVTLELVREYAATGVDVISVGALTTSAPWIDLSLAVE